VGTRSSVGGKDPAIDDEAQREARALGDPTRHRLFRYILTAPDAVGVGVGDLTNHVQLNHNAVRQHLAVLKEAKLVVEDVEVRRRRVVAWCCAWTPRRNPPIAARRGDRPAPYPAIVNPVCRMVRL
jgi:DNA-binding transcriptional ArsR family regulator